jgi:hypothetical protein
VSYSEDVVTQGYLNGHWNLPGSVCLDQVNCPLLDTRSSDTTGPISVLLVGPGIYAFSFLSNIHSPLCCYGVCASSASATATVLVGETDMNDCNITAGDRAGVSSGIVVTNETDFSLPGILPLQFTRYYNSSSALASVAKSFGITWSHLYDAVVTAVQSNLYRITNPDGSIYYYSDTNEDGTYEATIQIGRAHV